jgi:hypothetical protein
MSKVASCGGSPVPSLPIVNDHRGIDDRPQKAPLHHLEGLGLPGADLGLAVIDEPPRQLHPTMKIDSALQRR